MQTAHHLFPPGADPIPEMRPIHPNIQRLVDAQSSEFGAWSPPLLITQERIDLFARTTGDDQWIHTDPERAKKGPFKQTIAQGGLIVSLTAEMLRNELAWLQELCGGAVIYAGIETKNRAPAIVGSQIQAHGRIAVVIPSVRTARLTYTFEIRNVSKGLIVVVGDMHFNCIVAQK